MFLRRFQFSTQGGVVEEFGFQACVLVSPSYGEADPVLAGTKDTRLGTAGQMTVNSGSRRRGASCEHES